MWTEFLRAMARPSSACPHCGDSRVHASGHAYGPVAALLGVRAYRCEGCRRRFPVRAWLRDTQEITGRSPEFWPPEHWPPENWALPSPDRAILSERRLRERRAASRTWKGAERRLGERRRSASADASH
jgi:DNA-directed RNA polymerase subunit RPC12/RpoP